MPELKTLKDIGFSPDLMSHLEVVEKRAWLEEHHLKLRQEAIKWIKHWKAWQDKSVLPQDDYFYMMKGAKIAWVKHFFNITEEDLK